MLFLRRFWEHLEKPTLNYASNNDMSNNNIFQLAAAYMNVRLCARHFTFTIAGRRDSRHTMATVICPIPYTLLELCPFTIKRWRLVSFSLNLVYLQLICSQEDVTEVILDGSWD